MALFEFIASKLPGWMRRRTYAHWGRLAEGVSVIYDLMIEGLYQGRRASMPGQIDRPDLGGFDSLDALPLVGRDRRLQRGEDEEPWAYARRLRGFRAAHRVAGVGPWLLRELQAILRPDPPLVRCVTAKGRWWSREAGEGEYTLHTESGDGFVLPADGVLPAGGAPIDTGIAHQWVWGDGADDAEIFPIIYGPTSRIGEPLLLGDPSLILGTPTQTLGTTATPQTVEITRNVALTFKTAGIICPVIIVAFDPASFDPLAAPATPGYPDDGDWNIGTKVELDMDGDYILVNTRLDTAAYLIGEMVDELPS